MPQCNFNDVVYEALFPAKCCKQLCLFSQTSSFEETVQLIMEYREEIHNLDSYKKMDFIRDEHALGVLADLNGFAYMLRHCN